MLPARPPSFPCAIAACHLTPTSVPTSTEIRRRCTRAAATSPRYPYCGLAAAATFSNSASAPIARRVSRARKAHGARVLPSIWDTRIAFARVYERRKGRAGDLAYLYARSLLGAGRSIRLRSGPRRCVIPPEDGKEICGVGVEDGPAELDLRGRRLAFAWSSRGGFCPAAITSAWLDTIGGGRREIQSACSTELQGRTVLSPTISGGQVSYVRSLTGGDQGTAGAFWRYRIRSGQRTELATLKGRVVMWSTTDAGRTFYVLSGGYMFGCAADPLARHGRALRNQRAGASARCSPSRTSRRQATSSQRSLGESAMVGPIGPTP